MMDSITKNVKELYERYPYPYTDVKDSLLLDLQTLIQYLFYEAEIPYDEFSKYSFFDGGCGAGQRILGLASGFPDARFTGVDICEHSLQIATEQAKKNGVGNITFRQDNLVELREKEKYDIVTSVGVIHHLSDPLKALVNLSHLLNDKGLLVIYVYHTIGEYPRMLKREIARSLQGDEPLETGIRIMKELGYQLPAHQYGTYGYNPDLTAEDNTSKDADVFLHPRVFTYRFEEGIELFKGTELDWVAVNSINSLDGSYLISLSVPTEHYAFNPADHLKTDFLMSQYKKLSFVKKLRLIECILKPTAFSLVAGRQGGLSRIGKRLKNNITWLKTDNPL